MMDDRIWKLIARKVSGEATPEELKELEKLVKDNPRLHHSIETFTRLWESPVKESSNPDAGKLWERINAENKPPKLHKAPSLFSVKRNYMISNHFKIAWRNLSRGKAFSIIKILGLAIGIASALLLFLWIQNEMSFDLFHKKKDRIYLAYSQEPYEGKIGTWPGTSMLLGPILETSYPFVETTARYNLVSSFLFHAGDKHLEAHGLLTDQSFLSIFDFPLLYGDKNKVLSTPRSFVVTESFAKRLFGKTDVIGNPIRIDSTGDFMITGVLKDLPNNTDFEFEWLGPWSYMKEVHWLREDWTTVYIRTAVLLKAGTNEQFANQQIKDIVKKHSDDVKITTFLHPLAKWRLWSDFSENGKQAGGEIKSVRLFAVIACFILLLACINYMNLSTAKSMKRAREVGIRKVAGARKSSLIRQFLIESVLIALLAGIIALLIAEPNLRWFNALTYKRLIIPYNNPIFWLSFLGFILFTGILAGSYPAFYLAAYQPIRVLKGTFKAVNALVTPRKVLVVLQFTFAIAFIICTMVIYSQIRYGQKRDVGYNQNSLVYVYMKGDVNTKFAALSHELMASSAITSITRSNSPITDTWNGDDSYEWEGKKDGSPKLSAGLYFTDKDFAKTNGLQIIQGRDINTELYPADSTAILINEYAARTMGFTDPVGQVIKNRDCNWHIVGVVRNFLTSSPFRSFYPVVIHGPGPQHWFGTMSFRLNSQRSVASNLKSIGAILKKFNPDNPFDPYFAGQTNAQKFAPAKKIGTLASIFAGLAIFISCLGLFALAAYMAENRTKEIGVRKVLGASVASISTLLSKDFLKLVIISFCIASPIAWWAMNNWLNDFEYHVRISPWIFVATGVVSIVLAIGTVSFQSLKAALANPVKSLRSE
jgi:putative ABC transport system permease protein